MSHLHKPARSKRFLGCCAALVLGAPFAIEAQSDQGAPVSAINWLSKTFEETGHLSDKAASQGDVSSIKIPAPVAEQPLNAPNINASGLLSTSISGLPTDLWGSSQSAEIAQSITALVQKNELLHSTRHILNKIILAELNPPIDSDNNEILYLARIDALLSQARLEEANALIELSNTFSPALFQRSFDTKLLLGHEDQACQSLDKLKGRRITLETQIFCMARMGAWFDAVVTLSSAQSLDLVSSEQADLLSRFLDPELYEGEDEVVLSTPPTPLTFRLKESIGEYVSNADLPLAFLHSELRDVSGWKARVSAAEKLASINAISGNKWLGIWSEFLPAASGGVWDRLEALQDFEIALNSQDIGSIQSTLPKAWNAMRYSGLEVVFSELFSQKLGQFELKGPAKNIAFYIHLLAYTQDENIFAKPYKGISNDDLFLSRIAHGQELPSPRPSASSYIYRKSIHNAFQDDQLSFDFAQLIEEKQLGIALLKALKMLEDGASGDLAALQKSLQFLRLSGFEATAQRAALEILILGPRI